MSVSYGCTNYLFVGYSVFMLRCTCIWVCELQLKWESEIVYYTMGGAKGNEGTYIFSTLKGTENYKEWAREMGVALRTAGLIGGSSRGGLGSRVNRGGQKSRGRQGGDRGGSVATDYKDAICYRCQKKGHIAKFCRSQHQFQKMKAKASS